MCQMSDRAYYEASSSLLLVDTRASQSLEPIRLPAKLRDRIERAQRRANAAKDGVSIFTKDSKDSRRTVTAPETMSTADFEPYRSSTANEEKMHLPDVVLSHKMRDFEARANTGGVALYSVEPADRSLQRLSLEDRERVMLVMQSKIRQIASDVDANFARLTKALDANGIFDSAANIQRAQTLCLVDLQRRCKLEKLRDEAMREVLNVPTSTIAKNTVIPSQKLTVKPSDKLNQLLRPSSRVQLAETPPLTTIKRRKRKPLQSKLPKLRTADTKGNQRPLSPVSRPATEEDTKSRRSGVITSVPTSQSAPREEVTSAANVGSNDGDLYSRHPHVAQVLQALATGETSTNTSFNTNSAEADMEHARTLDPAEEWTQRNPSYQAVGARAAQAVRRCGERQRWDSLGHFGSKCFIRGLTIALRQRLESQQAAWKKDENTPRSNNGSDGSDGLEDSIQQRDRDVYAELQTQIRERLITTERRTRTAAAAIRVRGPSSRTHTSLLPQTAPAKMTTSSSAVALPVGQTLGLLGVSASEPVLHNSKVESPSPLKPSRLGSRSRMSILEQKILVEQSQPLSRHGRRPESLIGAPVIHTDSRVIGRHSEARIAYRRDTAQTWAWHLPPGSSSGDGVGTIAEEEEGFNEDTDLFEEGQVDEENNSEGEEADDATDDGEDDVESVDSSRTSFSSMSLSSVKRRTSNGNRKHGKGKRPPVLQRRASRGRSAGNPLTGHALSLHARLDVIFRVLQFPFSNKLSMLERLSTMQDADAFLSALEHWERVTPMVAIRQRMKMALSGYMERGELRPTEWLTASEFALVAALPQPASVSEPSSDLMPPLKTSNGEFESMSPSAFVEWVRDHIDAVTLQTLKLAHELKANTGEELQFQGHPYPSRR
ncbi:hypothetical protein P3T76_007877 [Phytophthora citrophthora]|uniref:Uncharacterized protein n=1 Tax=Phytophthora citrophthora TaxID=4793 RepID=A0AAD9GM22_9STRA|nr:hypothetical protein P3T76_007877 [Phytophthora citrophthora]